MYIYIYIERERLNQIYPCYDNPVPTTRYPNVVINELTDVLKIIPRGTLNQERYVEPRSSLGNRYITTSVLGVGVNLLIRSLLQ